MEESLPFIEALSVPDFYSSQGTLLWYHLLAFLLAPDLCLAIYGLSSPHNIVLFTIVTIVASILGGLFDYGLGYWGGQALLKRLAASSPWIDDNHKGKIQSFWSRYGLWTIVLGSFIPIPYRPMMLTIGTLRASFLRVLGGLFLGRTLRFCLIGGLISLFREAFGKYFQLFSWSVLGFILIVLMYRWWQKGIKKKSHHPLFRTISLESSISRTDAKCA